MRDLANRMAPRRGLDPVAATTDNTAYVSQIVDLLGYDSAMFVILTGTEADVDATFTTLVEDGNASNLSDNVTVPAAQLTGTVAQASFLFSDDNKVFKIGYVGNKRYVRVTITPANNTGSTFIAGVWILGNADFGPTPNPPA